MVNLNRDNKPVFGTHYLLFMVIVMNHLSEMIDAVLTVVIGQDHATEIVSFKERNSHSPHLFMLLSRNQTDSSTLLKDFGVPHFSTLL